jgi:hypothetical protein
LNGTYPGLSFTLHAAVGPLRLDPEKDEYNTGATSLTDPGVSKRELPNTPKGEFTRWTILAQSRKKIIAATESYIEGGSYLF